MRAHMPSDILRTTPKHGELSSSHTCMIHTVYTLMINFIQALPVIYTHGNPRGAQPQWAQSPHDGSLES